MTLKDFKKLDGAGKLITIWMKGVFLDSYVDENELFKLYALDLFFVEIKFIEPENIIIEVRSFKEGHLLDKYISKEKHEIINQLIDAS